MTDYEELSDEEYAAEMGRALDAGELEFLLVDGTREHSEIIFRSALKDRLYRRKPKPQRIQGYIAVQSKRGEKVGSNTATNLYSRVEELPGRVKAEGWVIIYIDQELPE
jgi:hypothetical protein